MINQSDLEAFDYYTPEEINHYPTVADMVAEFYSKANLIPDQDTSATLVMEEFAEWVDEYWESFGKPEDELKELSDLTYVIFGYAQSMGWDLTEAVSRVHSNNLGRMYQPDGTIKYREDGKVLKNKDYPKVNLTDLV